jgi:hypothetical protein
MPTRRRYPWAVALGLLLGTLGLTCLGLGVWRCTIAAGKSDRSWLCQGADAADLVFAQEVAQLEKVAALNQTILSPHPIARERQEARAREAIRLLRTTVPEYRKVHFAYQSTLAARGFAIEVTAALAALLCAALLLPTALWLFFVARLRLPE